MKEVTGEVRTIHPGTLAECPQETVMTLLEVARDLRSGAIRDDLFIMRHFTTITSCGTAHCIAGWVALYQGYNGHRQVKWVNDQDSALVLVLSPFTRRQSGLFAGSSPNDPKLAADAIEQYVYNYAEYPWEAATAARK